MAFKIVIQDFATETITKGRNSYEKGVVTYTFNGANKTQTLMSFANPAVFKEVKNTPSGTTLIVETTKNDKGYDQWSSVTREGATLAAPAVTGQGSTGAATRVSGSNYETPEERKQRQLFIIRQSSISNAIELLSVGSKVPPKTTDVLDTAQEFVDFVYGIDAALKPQADEATKDIPY